MIRVKIRINRAESQVEILWLWTHLDSLMFCNTASCYILYACAHTFVDTEIKISTASVAHLWRRRKRMVGDGCERYNFVSSNHTRSRHCPSDRSCRQTFSFFHYFSNFSLVSYCVHIRRMPEYRNLIGKYSKLLLDKQRLLFSVIKYIR